MPNAKVDTNELQATKKILVKLVEEVLQQYERGIIELEEGSSADVHTNHLFLQLKSILGEVLVDALCILDEQCVLLYTYEGSEIAEIQIKQQQYKSSIWLFPRVNYCSCKQFKELVLGLKDPIHETSSSAQTDQVGNTRYTCAHVLALRLAQVLHPTPSSFKIETVSKQQFKNLQDRMYCSYLELFKES